jgi:hypothetical protein
MVSARVLHSFAHISLLKVRHPQAPESLLELQFKYKTMLARKAAEAAAALRAHDDPKARADVGSTSWRTLQAEINNTFAALRNPTYKTGVQCPKCSYVWFNVDVLPVNAAGNRLCQFVRLPGSVAKKVCSTPLTKSAITRPHGVPIRSQVPVQRSGHYMPIRQYLHRWVRRHKEDELDALLNGWQGLQSADTDVVKSIYDGRVWRNFTEKWCPPTAPANSSASNDGAASEPVVWIRLAITEDGASPFFRDRRATKKTQGKSLVVCQSAILNLPAEERYKDHNVAVNYVGEVEPKLTLNPYTGFFVEELLSLYNEGMRCQTADGHTVLVKAVLMMSTADSPAKAKLMGTPSHSRKHACLHCAEAAVVVGGFKDWSNMSDPPARPRRYADAKSRATKVAWLAKSIKNQGDLVGQLSRGFRWTPFMQLPYYDIIEQTAMDVMHAVCEGTVKLFLQFYLEQDPSRAKRAAPLITNISARLPSTLAFPMSDNILERLGRAKAEEMQRFVLLYSLDVLDKLLPKADYDLWAMFQQCCQTWFAYEVTQTATDQAEALYRKFVAGFHARYPDQTLPWNVHACSHIGDRLRAFGPSFETWLYPYERKLSAVASLSFSKRRVGVDTTASKEFRLAMFTEPCIREIMARYPSSAHTQIVQQLLAADGTLAPAVSRGKLARSPVIQSMADFNRHLYDLGLDDDHPDMDLQLSGRPREIRLPQHGHDHDDSGSQQAPTPMWQTHLLDYLRRQKLSLVEGEPIRCYRSASLAGVTFTANPDTWELRSDLKINVQNMAVPRGSCVSVRFFVNDPADKSKKILYEYFGEIQAFIEATVLQRRHRHHPRKLRMMLVYWRKEVSANEKEQRRQHAAAAKSQAKSARRARKSKDSAEPAEPAEPAASAAAAAGPGPAPRKDVFVHNEAYIVDQLTPITRIGGRVAFVPVYNPDSLSAKAPKIAHFRVLRLPWVL